MQVTPDSCKPGTSDIKWATKVDDKNNYNENEAAQIIGEDVDQTKTDEDDVQKETDDFTIKGFKKQLRQLKVPFQDGGAEKLVFVISVSCLMLVGYGIVGFPWILPYFYTGALPFLFGLRVWLYWGLKWQLFLFDICYFSNLLLLIYLWAFPDTQQLFYIVFALANGPVLSAVIMYRNTLAFHSLDRMTSVFIHILPSMVTFAIRWYPGLMQWYKGFADIDDEERLPWEWILPVPYGLYLLHTLIYYGVVHVCIKPDEDYWDTYRYMTGKSGGIIYKMCNIFGARYSHLVFMALNWTYTLGTFLLAVLWFKYFIAHCTFIVITGLVLLWNGASFYIDVFSEKGLDAEPYRFCVK